MISAKRTYALIVIASMIGAGLFVSQAVASTTLNQVLYSGTLTDTTGETLAEGTYGMEFRLYDTETGSGTGSEIDGALWQSTYNGEDNDGNSDKACNPIYIADGEFEVSLGECDSIPFDVINNSDLYLEIRLDDENLDQLYNPDSHPFAFDEVFAPRRKITSTLSALNALQLVSQGDNNNTLEITENGDLIFEGNDGFGRVGIGTSSPQNQLSVDGESNIMGNLGIGTTTPNQQLSIGQSGVGLNNPGSNVLSFATNGSEQMRIDQAGNVGIGTTNPTHRLTVAGDANITGSFELNSGTRITEFSTDTTLADSSNNAIPTENAVKTYVDNNAGAGGSDGQIQYNNGGSLGGASGLFWDDSTNNIGIGTTNPDNLLTVNGNANVTGNVGIGTDTPNQQLSIGQSGVGFNNPGSNVLNFVTNGSEQMRIDQAGNIGIGTTSPTHRLTVAGDANITGSFELNSGTGITEFSTDTTLADSSNNAIPTENAVKTYVDNNAGGSPGGSNGQIQYNNGGSFGGASGLFWDDSTNNIGIGTTDPSERMTVQNGSILQQGGTASNTYTPELTGSLGLGGNPISVHVSGSYVYVVDTDSDDLKVINIADPSSPSQVGSVGIGGSPQSVDVSGSYAYVVDRYSYDLKVINISDPSSPSQVGSVGIGSHPNSVYVSGSYAYVVDIGSDDLKVIDISNPSSPSQVGSLGIGGGPQSVHVSGSYAYVVDTISDDLKVIDISNPSSPSQVSSLGMGPQPHSVHVSGSYAYVPDLISEDLRVIDISDPSSPSQVGSLDIGGGPLSVHASDSYVYVVDSDSDDLKVIDISDPSNPSQVGSLGIGGFPQSVHVSGSYAYVVDGHSEDLKVIDITGVKAQSADIASLEAGTANITQDLTVQGQGSISALNVGKGGILSNGVLSVSDNAYFRSNVGIGTTSPSDPLTVTGDGRFSGDVYATAFNTTSDATLKENFDGISEALEKINQLGGYTFDWTEDSGNSDDRQIGFKAQEVNKVFPELVSYSEEQELYSMSYGGMSAVLTEGIKELYNDQSNLRSDLDTLSSDLSNLTAQVNNLDFTEEGTIGVKALEVNNDLTTSGLIVTADGTIEGNLEVKGDLSIQGGVKMQSRTIKTREEIKEGITKNDYWINLNLDTYQKESEDETYESLDISLPNVTESMVDQVINIRLSNIPKRYFQEASIQVGTSAKLAEDQGIHITSEKESPVQIVVTDEEKWEKL